MVEVVGGWWLLAGVGRGRGGWIIPGSSLDEDQDEDEDEDANGWL